MLEDGIVLWFWLTFFSFVYVLWHNIKHNPVSWVQKLAWVLVTAYTGPVGLALYWKTCRAPPGVLHTRFTKPTWKQAVNSEMHCLAGDATGIIASAAIVYHFGLPNGIDLIIEYCSAFIVGLLVFQALMMKEMYHNDYSLAVRKTFFAETVSMNMVMVGMIPVMVLLMKALPEADNPWDKNFWFTMGMASIAGMATAYPINYWLVAKKLKHGCMTLTPPGEKTEGRGAHKMGALSLWKQLIWIAATFFLLLFVAYLTTFAAPIRF